MSYIDLVENVVLGLLRSSREGNWNLHLNAIRSMIPWCFAYDKVNYARYLTAYYAEMTNLQETNPDVYEAFEAGQFSVQLSCFNPLVEFQWTKRLKSQSTKTLRLQVAHLDLV